jgi:nucleotide-binding universal stress UspA family protein
MRRSRLDCLNSLNLTKENTMNNRIVVGMSGKPSADAALEWALDYADAHNTEIELVHVVDDKWATLTRSLTGTALLDAEHELRARAEKAAEEHPGLRIHPTVLEGSPIDALVERAEGAGLLAIGSHELGRFEGLVFSTRAAHVAALSTVDIAVVPAGRALAGRGVVVGVDGSASSVAALEFGAREADRLGQPLRAVYAWRALTPWTTVGDELQTLNPTDSDRLVLSEAVAGLADEYPDLDIQLELSRVLPADALMNAAVGARLLVVGTHGRHGVAKVWLGSVSHELVLSMPCSVVIVKPTTV